MRRKVLHAFRNLSVIVAGVVAVYLVLIGMQWLTPVGPPGEQCQLDPWNEEEQRRNRWHGKWFMLGGECK
ncbi:hypothetical protein LCGC14_2348340 [marine sediment metagenome]|uniref:Uncharacterized protein n=1 Tax=marine sediment metagenome TaxID=412755 RepID=A0A0F9C9T6_9ZZZZ